MSAAAADAPPRPRVAFQGELGAYGDEAITQRWGGAAEAVPLREFADVVAAVASGRAAYGVLPVWNTVVGDIASGCEAARLATSTQHGLVALDEIHVTVRHQLLALAGTTLDEIELVSSHPVALAQCGRFLARHPRMHARPAYDTAGAARDLAASRAPASAAIASRAAAERYGLVVVEADVQDTPDNVTRFLLLASAVEASILQRDSPL